VRKKVDSAKSLTVLPKFGRGIISIELSPGLEPSIILRIIANGGISAMIFKSLGEGNACSEGEYSLLPVIKSASEDYATPILLTTKFVGGKVGGAHYETGILAIKAGGVPCGDHTDVAVEVKTRWLLGNAICADTEGFKKAMGTSFVGEVTV
jgi:L-asparaginase/Glu-tRNA(Gln) amidotransferase subunit D